MSLSSMFGYGEQKPEKPRKDPPPIDTGIPLADVDAIQGENVVKVVDPKTQKLIERVVDEVDENRNNVINPTVSIPETPKDPMDAAAINAVETVRGGLDELPENPAFKTTPIDFSSVPTENNQRVGLNAPHVPQIDIPNTPNHEMDIKALAAVDAISGQLDELPPQNTFELAAVDYSMIPEEDNSVEIVGPKKFSDGIKPPAIPTSSELVVDNSKLSGMRGEQTAPVEILPPSSEISSSNVSPLEEVTATSSVEGVSESVVPAPDTITPSANPNESEEPFDVGRVLKRNPLRAQRSSLLARNNAPQPSNQAAEDSSEPGTNNGFGDTLPPHDDFVDTMGLNEGSVVVQPPQAKESEKGAETVIPPGWGEPSRSGYNHTAAMEKAEKEKPGFMSRVLRGTKKKVADFLTRKKEKWYETEQQRVAQQESAAPKAADSQPASIETPTISDPWKKTIPLDFEETQPQGGNQERSPEAEVIVGKLMKLGNTLDEKIEKTGKFKNFLAAFGKTGSKAWEGIQENALAYQNIPFKKKALFAAGLIGLGTFAGAVGVTAAVVIGGVLRGLGGVGIHNLYIDYVKKSQESKGSPESVTKTQHAIGAALGFTIAAFLPSAFHSAAEGLSPVINNVVTSLGESYDAISERVTNIFTDTTPAPPDIEPATPPVPTTESSVTPSPAPEPPAPQVSETVSAPSYPLETLVAKGEGISNLLAKPELFPELKDLSGEQMRNAIGNIVNNITPEMRESLGLPDNLHLQEGSIIKLEQLHEIIKDVRINGMTIVERALIETPGK